MQRGQTTRTVLLVDDDPGILRMLGAVLARADFANFRVLTAGTGAEALHVLDSGKVEILLTDNIMPDMRGTDLLEQVQGRNPEIIRLLMTAEPDAAALAAAINRGAVFRYIAKPFQPSAALSTLREAVKELEQASRVVAEKEQAEQENRMLLDLTYQLELDVQKRTAELESQKRLIEESHQHLLELTRQRADLLLILAHELNTPLAVLRGFVGLLQEHSEEWDADKRREVLGLLNESLDRLDGNVGRILQSLDTESAGLELRRERLDLRQIIEACARDAAPLVERRHQKLAVNAGQVPLSVNGEAGLLRNALDNLLLNAIRFTPDHGSILVSGETDGTSVRIGVADTGIGIPEEERERIFERFYEGRDPMQHTSGTIEFGSGSLGLGLAVTRSIVDRHGGQVRVESTVGKGSTFTVELPAAK